jgi:hypothetical protein
MTDRKEKQRSKQNTLTIQLMAIEMFGARIALSAAIVRTFKLLVETLPASSPLLG